MRLTKDPLEEWALHCDAMGARISLDSSGAPAPFNEPEWKDVRFKGSNDEAGAEARLREELRRAYRVDDDMIALPLDAQEADVRFFLHPLSARDRVAVENTTCMPIRRQAQLICDGRTLDRPASAGFRPDRGQLRRFLGAGARAVALTNLHNPSASALRTDELASIIEEAGKYDALVLCDEVYREMAYQEVPKSAYELGENGVSVSSVTKLNGLRGLRLGWLIGPKEVAQNVEMARMYLNYRLPVHSCLFAAEAVKRREWFRERVLERARTNLPILKGWLEGEKRIVCRLPDGGLMASLCLPEGTDDLEFSEVLLKEGAAVGPGRLWGAPGTIRATFSCPGQELAEGLRKISEVLDQNG